MSNSIVVWQSHSYQVIQLPRNDMWGMAQWDLQADPAFAGRAWMHVKESTSS